MDPIIGMKVSNGFPSLTIYLVSDMSENNIIRYWLELLVLVNGYLNSLPFTERNISKIFKFERKENSWK